MPENTPTVIVPTYPVQRVIRTLLVDVVVWVPTLVVIVPQVLDTALELSRFGVIPPEAYARIAAVGAAALAISGVVSRLIALPTVNRLLTRIGAGTVPRRAARAEAVRVVKDTRAAVRAIEASVGGTP